MADGKGHYLNQVRIPQGQPNMTANGRYYVRVNAAPDNDGNPVFQDNSENTIVIHSQGYEAVTVVLHADGSLKSVSPKHETADNVEESEKHDEVAKPTAPDKAPNANDNFNGGCSLSFGKYQYEDWMNAITGLVVNGTDYTEITSGSISDGQYRKYAETCYLDFGGLADGVNTVHIKVSGDNDLLLQITKSVTAWGDVTYEAQIVK